MRRGSRLGVRHPGSRAIGQPAETLPGPPESGPAPIYEEYRHGPVRGSRKFPLDVRRALLAWCAGRYNRK